MTLTRPQPLNWNSPPRVSNAKAEPVSIQSAFDTTGQGWLFGASGGSSDVECWVLAPRHVVSSEISGKSSPFTFVTKQRQVGFTGMPVVLEDILSEEADMDAIRRVDLQHRAAR